MAVVEGWTSARPPQISPIWPNTEGTQDEMGFPLGQASEASKGLCRKGYLPLATICGSPQNSTCSDYDRISAKDALDAEYFWTDPLPCDPKSLPKYESSHEFQTKKKRQQQRQHEETAKRQKLQHPQQHARLPPIQQTGQAHLQLRPGPNQPVHNSQPPVVAGPSHHYGKPRGGPSGGPNSRYPPSGNASGGYNHPNRGGQGGGYSGGPYPPQGRGAPYAASGMPSTGPRGGGSGYGVGAPNYPQGGPYGGSGAGRGSNMSGNRNPQYGWQQ
ncbi:hypothetical protein HHK36_011652 [Tetracentron sinense]|uniref:Uncharacterized protein n=1 Tax=Tetracentron sinense TaxID=13715 RepID=A0A835DGF7_TETSI|nr:hypothetical protein HHK36_011652 [Tetracentron sinense]